jgi:lysozyme family protein
MDRINKLKSFILSWEGGFVNDPRDPGGATNRGITIATFRHVFGKDKTVNDLKKITDSQWTTVFKKYFWDKYKADNIKDEWIAYLLVDWLWTSGSDDAINRV